MALRKPAGSTCMNTKDTDSGNPGLVDASVLEQVRHRQMKVIRHEAIRVDLPAGLGADLRQGFHKAPPVRVVVEDRFPPVALIHDVVNGPGILNCQLARHTSMASLPKRHVC